MKNLVGIDISLNSTGVTVLNDTVTFYSIFRADNISKFEKQNHIQLMINQGDVKFFPVQKTGKSISIQEVTDKKGKTKKIKILNYSATEVNKMTSNVGIAKSLSAILNNSDIVGMEGMAYGAKGSSIIDIAMLTGLLRGTIVQIVEDDKFSVFAPSEVKKFATGSGAANKLDMFESFLNEDVKLAHLIKNNKDVFVNKKGEIIKPIDDIVDSYFIAKLLKHRESL